MDFANPTFEQMVRHWFDSFCTNPVLSPLLTLALVFDFAGGRHGGLLADRLRENHVWFEDRWMVGSLCDE
jgi:hypothetical protein